MPNQDNLIKSVAIVGLGLIGGSLAKSFANIGLKIYGVDIDKPTLLNANEDKIFELLSDSIEDILFLEVDLIYIALPVNSALKILEQLKGYNGLITDASSTKESICRRAKELGLNFIGGHPIAGKEVSGYINSEANLMNGARHVLINSAKKTQLASLVALHKNIGMRVDIMHASEHDEIFAAVSHLPHLIAFNLIDYVKLHNSNAFNFVGAGFKDFTRIAASDERMWADILIDNKVNILKAIDSLEEVISDWRNIIEVENVKILEEKIRYISSIRRELK